MASSRNRSDSGYKRDNEIGKKVRSAEVEKDMTKVRIPEYKRLRRE